MKTNKKSKGLYIIASIIIVYFGRISFLIDKARRRKHEKHTFLINRSKKSIWFKPDESVDKYIHDQSYELRPMEKTEIPIDGIATEHKKDCVFKVPDGAIVVVKNNGIISLDYCGAEFYAKNVLGGWRNMSDKDDWKNLHKKAKQIN